MLGETDDFRRDTVISLLPAQFFINGRHVQVEYRFIEPGQMMLVITDTTEKVRLEQEVEKEHKQQAFIVAALENKHDFLTTLSDLKQFVQQDMHGIVSAATSLSEAVAVLFRKVHTLKGILNQYEMPETPLVLHRMEQGLSDLSNSCSVYTRKQLRDLLQATPLTEAIAQDTAILESSLGRSFFKPAER